MSALSNIAAGLNHLKNAKKDAIIANKVEGIGIVDAWGATMATQLTEFQTSAVSAKAARTSEVDAARDEMNGAVNVAADQIVNDNVPATLNSFQDLENKIAGDKIAFNDLVSQKQSELEDSRSTLNSRIGQDANMFCVTLAAAYTPVSMV